MDKDNLSNFLKALDAVKQDCTCPVCHEMCRDPITLSKCLHMICSEHFEGLETCHKCGVSLAGCTTFVDNKLGSCIDSAKELDQMFEKYRNKDNASSKADQSSYHTSEKHVKSENTSKTSKQVEKKDTSKGQQRKEGGKKRIKQAIEKITVEEKEHKTIVSKKIDSTSRGDNINLSEFSTRSSKVKKACEKRNINGETLLHIACRLGKVDEVTELLEQGANINTKDNAGWTPLHEAVQNGNLDLLRLLLQHNALVNVPGQSNETPLHEAVRNNFRQIAEELVTYGANLYSRNSKGETPIQLASDEMKAILETASKNIIQTQSTYITRISEINSEFEYQDIRLFCASESRIVQNKLKLLLKHHSNMHLEEKWTKRVSHLIVDTDNDGVCKSSLEVLQGIVASVWILSTKWIMKSSEEILQPFGKFEVTGVGANTCNGPRNARHNKYKQVPGIFDGCHFYLHNFTGKHEISEKVVLTKQVLNKLITDAGGVVLKRAPNPESIPEAEKLVPYHAKKGGKLVNCSHYIIFKDLYEPMYNMQHLKALPIGWLIECIEKYELC